MKAQYDKKKCPAIEYQVGDKVWLDMTNLNLPRPKKKLADKQMAHSQLSQRREPQHTCSNSLLIGTFTQHSTKHSSPHMHHPHSPIKNSHLHHHQTLLTVLNTMKSRKSSTVENTKSEEKLENHGTGLQITSSNGKDMDQSQTVGYGKTTWTLRNSSTSTSPNM